MYLKNLTVLGFKSFADKTSLNFQPGVTAIVGPNGCGKSNVSDAIRWVLGEQSAKALRGGEMADVIFNGTDGRKPLGMAEVSLTIGGVDEEHLRASGVEVAYNEVTITRRVFRDGGSEYFINKTPCRLKDIQQLFMGTGVGRTSYSIMAQGNITQILSSKPEERRLVFEEAAGITKYKAHKKEALRKLEYTEQNLLRVADLVREVKRQIGSLQRQAGKARRYKQFAQELQHLDSQLARHQFDILQTEISERQAAADQLRSDIEHSASAVLHAEDEITQLRQRLSELDHNIALKQQQGLELKAEMDRNQSHIQFNEERLRELASQNSKAMNDMTQAEERRLAALDELNVVDRKLAEAESAVAQHKSTLAQKQQTLEQLENDLRREQESLRQAHALSFAAAQDLARGRNEINALDLQKQGNIVRLEKLSSEKIQLEEERTRLEARLDQFAADVEAEKMNAATQRGTLAQRQHRLKEVQEQLNCVAQDLDQALRQQAEKRSRLNVLQQLQADHEGFSAGSVAALKQSQHVLGSLADKIRVPNEYVTAIETALGHHLQLVLTEEPEAAHQILADLSTNKRGRASIAALALSRIANGNGNSNERGHVDANGGNGNSNRNGYEDVSDENQRLLETPPDSVEQIDSSASAQGNDNGDGNGRLQPALECSALQPGSLVQFEASHGPVQLNGIPLPALRVVEADSSVQPLLVRLLGTTCIVRDLSAATAAWRESTGRHHYVTLGGDVLSSHGVFTGGYTNGNGEGKGPASILGRKNQIAELHEALVQLQESINETSRRKGALQSEQTELQAGLQEAQTELRAREVAIATHEGEFNALRASQRLLHQKIETVVFEIQTLAAQEEEGRDKRAALETKLAELASIEQAQQDCVAQATTRLENLRQQREASQSCLTESKVALATQEQMRASFGLQKQSLEQRARELGQVIEQRRAELGSFVLRKEHAELEIQRAGAQIEKLEHERDQVNEHSAALLADKQAQETEVNGREEALREQRRHLSDVQQRRSALEVELAQKSMSIQNLRERIQQKYHLNLDEVRSECITITFADEGPARVHVLTPQEMDAAGAATDWQAVAQQVDALQQRLDEMGPVNLVAIEEYEETEQRYQFLSKQHDDLVQAKAQLLEVINRINGQTRDMFRQTFEQIRENFRLMFVEVFGGGKADLILLDENDLLESGIDIVARPPGKQLQTISLLSGGEQTMTAVALLFSIYQVRPSPFCVLDELDAPLDESNINRFIRILQRFLAHSQFIIITHNKRTIGMSDVLYGVTMQEQGISRIVSMRLRKAEEESSGEVPAAVSRSFSPGSDGTTSATSVQQTGEVVLAK